MKVNLSATVKDLCRMQGITLKDLAHKIGIAPESLSRTLNGNPQLSTLEVSAKLHPYFEKDENSVLRMVNERLLGF